MATYKLTPSKIQCTINVNDYADWDSSTLGRVLVGKVNITWHGSKTARSAARITYIWPEGVENCSQMVIYVPFKSQSSPGRCTAYLTTKELGIKEVVNSNWIGPSTKLNSGYIAKSNIPYSNSTCTTEIKDSTWYGPNSNNESVKGVYFPFTISSMIPRETYYVYIIQEEGSISNACSFYGNTSATATITYEESAVVPTSYTITLNPNGGILSDTDKTITVTYGSDYGTLPTPTQNGYQFDGWFLEDDTQIIATTKVTLQEDHTLYAHWTEVPIIIKYHWGQSDRCLSGKITTTTPYIMYAYSGQTFNYNGNFGGLCGLIDADYSFQLEKDNYFIDRRQAWRNQDNNLVYSDYGADNPATPADIKVILEQYGLLELGDNIQSYLGQELSEDKENIHPVDWGDTVNLEPNWAQNLITYNTNGGSGTPDPSIKHLSDINGITITDKTPTPPAASTTTITLTYAANGGSSTPSSQTGTVTIPKVFDNWNTEADGSGIKYTSGASYTTNTSATLYAQWKDGTRQGVNITTRAAISRTDDNITGYKVTFNSNAASIIAPAALTSTKTRTYTFAHWVTNNGTQLNASTIYTFTTDNTLTAQWNHSDINNAIMLPAMTRNGYTFKGWSTSSTATSGITGSYTPSENITLYAIWEPNHINIYTNNTDKWKPYDIYIYHNNKWNQYVPFIWDGSKWVPYT